MSKAIVAGQDAVQETTRLGQFLRRHQLISQPDLEHALSQLQKAGVPLGEWLCQSQRVDSQLVDKLLQDQRKMRSLLRAAESELIHSVTRLGDLLHYLGHVNKKQVDRALAKQRKRGGRLGDILLEGGHLSVQGLHDALKHQTRLRATIVAVLASMAMAGSLTPLVAEADWGSSDSASVTITLQILPPRPEIVFDQQLDGQEFNATGATFYPDGAGGYIVEPLESTPSGMPYQSMQFQLDEAANALNGVMNIFIVPR